MQVSKFMGLVPLTLKVPSVEVLTADGPADPKLLLGVLVLV